MTLDNNLPQRKESTFAKKYGLEGKGMLVKISQRTQDYVKSLYKQAQKVIEQGKEYANLETRTFGHN